MMIQRGYRPRAGASSSSEMWCLHLGHCSAYSEISRPHLGQGMVGGVCGVVVVGLVDGAVDGVVGVEGFVVFVEAVLGLSGA